LDAAKINTGTLSADRITGTTISYYSGSTLTTQINSNGLELTRDNVKIGRIGTNSFTGNSSWRGLVFDLEYAGNYMTWAWKESTSASAYTTKFTYYRSKLSDGMEKGFHFDDVVFLKGGVAVGSGSSVVTTQVHHWSLGSDNCFAMRTSNSKAGFAMGGNNLILGDDGQWVDFGVIREICKKLAGKTIALPCGFNSSGQATSWYNPETYPSMTWWTT
ncbi:MAG: hypothetical protein LBQ48_02805, partial [Oscillospiraceae bacterium]|nr:hypothetical protein [Oscillospiraceae bacterium]